MTKTVDVEVVLKRRSFLHQACELPVQEITSRLAKNPVVAIDKTCNIPPQIRRLQNGVDSLVQRNPLVQPEFARIEKQLRRQLTYELITDRRPRGENEHVANLRGALSDSGDDRCLPGARRMAYERRTARPAGDEPRAIRSHHGYGVALISTKAR
jgi:hypothetical protein